MTIDHIDPGEWNSRAVIHNDYVWLSGIVAGDKMASITDQTTDVLAKIDAFLTRAGSDRTKIVNAIVYMSDISQKDEMNAVWMDWLGDANPPARACVGVHLTPNTKVEIMCQAVRS